MLKFSNKERRTIFLNTLPPLILGIVSLLGNYLHQIFSWENNNVVLSISVIVLLAIIFLFAIYRMSKWIKPKILAPLKQIKIPNLKNMVVGKERKKLIKKIAKLKAKRKVILYGLIKEH